ncbi:L-threonylcarbamoyladenylate synthase [Orbus hercynius]|uniref:Threonylcarbamoyl-AMP synthase n=1 Tax=Orbus hercynius TaxID=593135 RepID=A0A495RF51_9GAMM|nr:Sua5/YciO/YrdC/YwlC family protein [Orbus hercynius]RKS85836.1 L-threonylcarbamoyladenylate synthase [Orbus hercynius]
MTTLSLTQSYEQLIAGNVLAYPTEAVFGLGCDPDCKNAVLTILALKNRPIEKGLILIASDFNQLIPYIDQSALTQEQKTLMFNSWPGPVTWVVPKHKTTPYFLTGEFDSIAVRVTAHPLVREMCQLFGKPLVSTSANQSGQEPCRSIVEIEQQFGKAFPALHGEIGTRTKPSEIRDIQTGQIIRQG